MTNDNHFGAGSLFRGIKGIRWFLYKRPLKAINDPTFGTSDTKTNDACDKAVAHCPPIAVNPETLI